MRKKMFLVHMQKCSILSVTLAQRYSFHVDRWLCGFIFKDRIQTTELRENISCQVKSCHVEGVRRDRKSQSALARVASHHYPCAFPWRHYYLSP